MSKRSSRNADTRFIQPGTSNKHTRNPDYKPGNHWVVCDVCGFDVRHFDAKETWDGKVVCPRDWEMRHPQDFVRGRSDDTAAKGLVRTEPADRFVDDPTEDTTPPIDNTTIPPGTFNENTL